VATRRRASRRTITGSLSDIDRRLKFVETRPSPSRLANQVVRRTNIQPRAVSTDQIQLLSITNSLIEKRTVGEAELAENSVTGLQVAPEAITSESFAPGAVDNAALAPDSVGSDNYQDGSVGGDALAPGAASEDKIADGAVTTSKIENGAVTTEKVANLAITAAKIANLTIDASKIQDGQVNNAKLQNNSVSTVKIQDGAVTAAKLGSNSVSTVKIADLAVTGIKLANNSVTSTKYADGSILSSKIAFGATIATNVNAAAGMTRTTASLSGGGTQYNLAVDFGTGSNQVPRGNHTHDINNESQNTIGTSGLVANHTHAYFRSANQTSTPSTKRVKKDISDYSVENTKKILNLQLKKYKYKNSLRSMHNNKNKEWLYGYIAEEVLELGLEEIVGYDKKGKPDSLDYSLISLFLVELAKVHESEINSLKEEIQRLKESK